MSTAYVSRTLSGQRVIVVGGRVIAALTPVMSHEEVKQLAAKLGHILVYQIGTPLQRK